MGTMKRVTSTWKQMRSVAHIFRKSSQYSADETYTEINHLLVML